MTQWLNHAIRLVLLALWLPAWLAAQTPTTRHVTDYAGNTLAEKLTAAQVGCSPSAPCNIILAEYIPKPANEVLPEKCSGCTWLDYRFVALPVGTGAGTMAAGDDNRFGGGPGSVAWGAITGTVSAQTDLQSILDAKAGTSHGHAIGDTTGLQTALDGKAAATHGHAIGDTTGLQTALDGKAASSHGHAIADTTGLQTALDGKAASSHGHSIADTTGLQTALDGKQAALGFTPENAANKNGASGYAGLDANIRVPTAQLGSGSASGSTFLRGDQTWATPSGGGGESETIIRITSDVSNATTTLADATGLSFAMAANTDYIVEGWVIYATSVTTVGIKLSANGPASPTAVAGIWYVNAANGTPDGGAFNAYNTTVAASAAPFTTNNLATIWALVRNGTNPGNFIVRFAAETTGTVTIKAGSVLRVRQAN